METTKIADSKSGTGNLLGKFGTIDKIDSVEVTLKMAH